jgi:hypothetical protein
MLLEQAFFHLPEILHGSGYQQQEYEGGIVGAFSLALLQALNGRNVTNPIACLQNERRFRPGGTYLQLANPRHLRADLYLDISRLFTATRRLAQYGWRHHNWIEAKFLRGQAGEANTHCTNKTNYVAGHLADLIRLATLVPEHDLENSSSGRYFLHVYDAPPEFYLTSRVREWCRAISEPGTHAFLLENLDAERPRVRQLLGELPGLSIALSVTNFVIKPSDYSHLPCYWCILTRVDALIVCLHQHAIFIGLNRSIHSDAGDIDAIAAFVAERLHIPAASPEAAAPPEVEPNQPLQS